MENIHQLLKLFQIFECYENWKHYFHISKTNFDFSSHSFYSYTSHSLLSLHYFACEKKCRVCNIAKTSRVVLHASLLHCWINIHLNEAYNVALLYKHTNWLIFTNFIINSEKMVMFLRKPNINDQFLTSVRLLD